MDIRTKMIFALVAVALASMTAFGALVATDVEGRLRDATLHQLDELAESKREALGWIIEGWRERTALVASRTQLRQSLDRYGRDGGAAEVERIEGILSDALRSSNSLTLLRVRDLEGRTVASATSGTSAPLPARATEPPQASDGVAYVGVEFAGSGPPEVSFAAPLVLSGRRVGSLLAVFAARELDELTGHYHGLGESGEVLVVAEGPEGVPRTLHPTRHRQAESAGVELVGGEGSLASRALGEESEPLSRGMTDYRGAPVWVATRYVEDTGWGLVVKVDDSEQGGAYDAFRDSLLTTAIVLAAFSILAGFVLGLRLAIPIHDLSEVANRIRKGDMRARAEVGGQDEVGLLARTFNQMADEIEEQLTLLHEFERFFDVSIDLMCMAGVDGYFRRVNPAFERSLGWSEDELLEQPFFHFVHPDDVDKTAAELEKLGRGIPTISFENRYRCKDGTYKLLRWTSYPDAETDMLYATAHVLEEA